MPAEESMHYLSRRGALEYIEARRGLESAFLSDQLRTLLPVNSEVLELGSGPGADASFLTEYFELTCSDYSPHFVKHLQDRFPDLPVLQLNAASLNIDKMYDCLFSNKVLHHLSGNDMKASLSIQKTRIRSGGVAFHTFWIGDQNSGADGLEFRQFSVDQVREIVSTHFKLVRCEIYSEINFNDSVLIAGVNR